MAVVCSRIMIAHRHLKRENIPLESKHFYSEILMNQISQANISNMIAIHSKKLFRKSINQINIVPLVPLFVT
jgi:hypothetical protein